MQNVLKDFLTKPLYEASEAFLDKLDIQYNRISHQPINFESLYQGSIPQTLTQVLAKIKDLFFIGNVTEESLEGKVEETNMITVSDQMKKEGYQTMMIFSVETKKTLSRTECATLTRGLNRLSKYNPVIVFIKESRMLSLATCERTSYAQDWREGERLGRVNMLRNVNLEKPHRGHIDLLNELNTSGCVTFEDLYKKLFNNFNISVLNKRFYSELQNWFYWAVDEVKLPEYDLKNFTKEQQNKNFLVRLLSRMMFCWFLKEKHLVNKQLLELTDAIGNRYPILKDLNEANFLETSSYYRGILQNIFFNGLNKKEKNTKKDLKWTKYLSSDFDYSLFFNIPYLNGGTFRPTEEDFAKESIEDDIFLVPNKLFYGSGNHKGINGIFNDYKFTVEENTPLDIDIALDPEMLGMVFENLLAEIDPQNDEGTAKSIRKATGSFYTPRPVIHQMVNESVMQYLTKQLNGDSDAEVKSYLRNLLYYNVVTSDKYSADVVKAMHNIRVLDPACGSGAFPMGMLQRVVDVLRLVDPDNKRWMTYVLEPVNDIGLREQFKQQLIMNTSDYTRKLGIIRNCIYGIDIQPIAVQITKLRFFISLLADQKIDQHKENFGVMAFPNLETKIVCADSLKNLKADMFMDNVRSELIKARSNYYQPNISPKDKEIAVDKIADILDVLFPRFAVESGLKQVSNKAMIKRWFMDANVSAPFFDMKTFFPELEEGFDIVIGNPPYGGFKISQEVRDNLHLGSNDPYGAFIARFLGNGIFQTPLKNGGFLAFIVSDTFMTIGTHLELRKQMMNHRIHKMIRMSPKTFSATVSTAIILCEKCKVSLNGQQKLDNVCTMADMTNIDIHEDYQHFEEILQKSMDMSNSDYISNEEYAIYRYPQNIIRKNSNFPFFVASPKLFALMDEQTPKRIISVGGKQVAERIVIMNEKAIELIKLGDVSDVKVGLQTGDNPAYLFQETDARGGYRNISDFEKYILTDEDFSKIISNNTLRIAIIENGISRDNPHSNRYFGGRYIAKYDKGGESDTSDGWIPNYYVPSDYYIDWSEWAVNRMKTLKAKDRDLAYGKLPKGTIQNQKSICSRFQNADTYFLSNIAFSRTGIYAPSFRIGVNGPYDSKACALFISGYQVESVIGLLTSKLQRYLQKTYINHTIEFGIEYMKQIPLLRSINSEVLEKAVEIISKQKKNSHYDYASHEQIEIDKLIYAAYGLNKDDIREVETWYKRRYPRLSAAQEANLNKLS